MADIPAAPAVPSITGNPVIDSAIRSLVMTIGASLSTVLIGFLAAHGVNNANLDGQIPVLVGAILSLLVTIAVGV